jgi:methylated-DNA-[protein]-cysteine S-methyltransferase
MFSHQLVAQSGFDSPLGRMILAATPSHLVGVWFDGQSHQPSPDAWPVDDRHPILMNTKAQLSAYFSNPEASFDLPLDLSSGTVFQQAIWRTLMGIAPGKTSSYGVLSTQIGKPAAVRAAGGAIGRNPFSIIIPCHRVIGAGGALTGYAGGLARKTALLKHEGAL